MGLPLGWSGPWIASITGSCNVSPGGIQGNGGVGVEPIHHSRRQCGKQALRGSVSSSQGGRTRSRNILRLDRFWTYVSGPLDGREQGVVEQAGIDLDGEKKRSVETTTRSVTDLEEGLDVESNGDSKG